MANKKPVEDCPLHCPACGYTDKPGHFVATDTGMECPTCHGSAEPICSPGEWDKALEDPDLKAEILTAHFGRMRGIPDDYA